jgi:hypothetical protein
MSYEARTIAIVKDWGSIEVLGMQPAIRDLRPGSGVTAEAFDTEVQAWTSALTKDKEQYDAIPVPPRLGEFRSSVDSALDAYLGVARTLGRAAAASGTRRAALINEAVKAGAAGDAIFDRGVAALQRARRELGLPPNPDYPQSSPPQ